MNELGHDRSMMSGRAASYVRLSLGITLLIGSTMGCQQLATQSFALSENDLATNVPVAPPGGAEGLAFDKNGQPVEVELSDQLLNQAPPAELNKVSLPKYRIEPPDVLLINAIRMAPKAPYYIQTLDVLQIVVAGTLPDQPIAGTFQVDPSGRVDLGPTYGSVKLAGLSVSEATDAITKHLQSTELTLPQVSVVLLQASGQQLIAGEHLVGPDGTVNLGKFGSVYVSGMTIDEARKAIEEKLTETLDNPEISLDVFTYNSKSYYIIVQGAGFGDNIVKLPITGNETVLDAISNIQGLQRISSHKMWIARPAPSAAGCEQILPVDWDAITKGAATATNYQLLPGDRLFVAQDRLVAFESIVIKLTAPFERIFGFSLLGAQTIQTIQRFPEGFRNF